MAPVLIIGEVRIQVSDEDVCRMVGTAEEVEPMGEATERRQYRIQQDRDFAVMVEVDEWSNAHDALEWKWSDLPAWRRY